MANITKVSAFLRPFGAPSAEYFELKEDTALAFSAANFQTLRQGNPPMLFDNVESGFYGSGYMKTSNSYPAGGTTSPLTYFPIKADKSGLYRVFVRVWTNEATLNFSLYHNEDEATDFSQTLTGPEQGTWTWFESSIVIPDNAKFDFGIELDSPNTLVDSIYITTEVSAPVSEPTFTEPFITLHAKAYEVSVDLQTVGNEYLVYDYKNSLDSLKAADWYNFSTSPLADTTPLTTEEKFAFSLIASGSVPTHRITWDEADPQLIQDEYSLLPSLTFESGSWDSSFEITRAIRAYSPRDPLDEDACEIVSPASEEDTFILQRFDLASVDPVFVNTSITNDTGFTNEVQLDLPDRIVNLLIDQSGSMTWNDTSGLRHDLARRLVNRLEATYPGDVFYNIFSFESTPIRVNFFAVVESDDIDTNDTSAVASSFFGDQESGYAGVRVVRKASSPPRNAIDGDIVTEGFLDRAFDDNLEENEDYYYKVFTFDRFGTFSEGVDLIATPRVREIPNGVGSFNAIVLNGSGPKRDDNTIGLWHFNEGIGVNVYDFSDTQVSLLYDAPDKEPTWLNQADVPYGTSGVRFNGIDGGFTTTNVPNSFSSDNNDLTISAWIYPFEEQGASLRTICAQGDFGALSQFDWSLYYSPNGNNITFTRNLSSFAVSDVDSVTPNQWNHVVVVYNSTMQEAQIFVNGVAYAPSLVGDTGLHNGTPIRFTIGGTAFVGIPTLPPFFGKIADVSIDNTIRSAGHIQGDAFLPGDDDPEELDNGDRLTVLNYTVPSDFNYMGGKVRIVSTEEAGPATYSYTGNTDDSGNLEQVFEGFAFEPFHENDGTVVYEENASAGSFSVLLPGDYVHGRSYNYRIFSQNLIGNYSVYTDSPNIEIEVPGFAEVTERDRVIGAPTSPLPIVDNVDIQIGNRKLYLRWTIPGFDDRVREVRVYRSTGNFPIIGDNDSTAELVYKGNLSEFEFVHRNIENDIQSYYAFVTVDQYGYFSTPTYATAIPSEDADETGIPLLEIQQLRYEVVNEDSLSLQWNQPVRFQKSIVAWFDQRVALFAQITDEFGAPIADDSRIEITASGNVSSAQLAEDVFREVPNRESFTPEPEDTYILSSTPLGNGTIRAILRMTPDFNIISAINQLRLTTFVFFSIPSRDNPSQNVFEFKSLPISIEMNNPFSMELINLKNDKIEHLCKDEFPVSDITEIATGGLLFNPNRTKDFDGTFIRRQEPFVARVKVKYRGEAIEGGGKTFVAVHEASDPDCDEPSSGPDSDPQEFVPSFSNRKSRTVVPPATTIDMQPGTEEGDDPETLDTFSFADIPLQPPQFPQGVMLFAKASYNGYFSRKRIYIAFENILRVEVTANPPAPDCVDVAEQFATCYIIDPDSPNPKNPIRNRLPDGTLCKWTLQRGPSGKDRPFYSTENVASGPGVFSLIRNNQARRVFFGPACGVTWLIVDLGPQNGGIAFLPEIYALKASVVFDGLSAFEERPLFIYPQEVTGGFGSRFLMNFSDFRVTMWADGFDYEKLTIWHDPNSAGGWAARGFRTCSEQFGGVLFVLNGGQFVEVESGSTFELLYGDDLEIGFDPYIDEPVFLNNEQQDGFGIIPLTNLDNKTEVFFRINKFIGPPPEPQGGGDDDDSSANRCEALNIPSSAKQEDDDIVVFGRTEVIFDDEIRYLTGGGDLENGIPPTLVKLREPLAIRILEARRAGVPVQEILVDGQSEHEFIVDVSFSGRPVPNGTPVRLTVGGPNPQKIQLSASVIFTEQVDDPFLTGGVRSLARFRVLPLSPIEQFKAQVQAECNYDKRGDVERSMTSCLTIDYKIETAQIDDDDEEEDDVAQIDNVFNGQVEIYDTVTDQWEIRATRMNHPRGSLTLDWSFDSYGEILHAIGGIDGTAVTAYNEQYRIDTDEWIALSPMPTARFYHSSAQDAGFIYIFGGLTIEDNDLVVTPSVERYDPFTDSWAIMTQMPDLGDGAADVYGVALGALVKIDNFVYIIGGIKDVDAQGGIRGLNDRILIYDIENDSWSASAPFTGSDLVLYERIAPAAFYDDDADVIRVTSGAIPVGTGQDQTLEFLTDSFAIDLAHLEIAQDDNQYQDIPTPRYKSGFVSIDSDHFILGGANKNSNVLSVFEKFNTSTSTFSFTDLTQMEIARQAFGMTTDDLRYIYVAGGVTSGRPAGFLQINATATPSLVRLDGRQSATVDIELINDVGEPPQADIRVLVRGFLILSGDEDRDDSDDLSGGGSGSDQGQQQSGDDVARSALIYPVQFSSNDFIVSNGFGSTVLLPRSEDILDKVDEIVEKLEAARAGEDTSNLDEIEPLVIEEGSQRQPYQIRVQITVIDDFYFGQTVVDIADNEDPDILIDPDDDADNTDDTDDTDDTTDDNEPPTAEEDPYSPEFEDCRSFSATKELPPQPGDDDGDNTDDDDDDGTNRPFNDSLDDRDNPIFELNPPQTPQLESPTVSYFSDIEWIPQVIPHINTNLGTGDEVLAIISRLSNNIPFGASPFYDGIAGISEILLDETLDPFSKIVYVQTDNEESLSLKSLDEALEDVQAIDGFAQVPVLVNNFSVVFPTTLSALLARTDTDDLEQIANETGGQSQTVLDAEFIDEVLNNMIGRAAGSVGWGTYSCVVNLGQPSVINTISLDFSLFENTDGNWTVESSEDGFNFSEPSDQFDGNQEVEFFRLIGQYFRFRVTLLSGLSASVEEAYDDTPTPGRPTLAGINVLYSLPKESFLYLTPDTSLFGAQQIIAAVHATQPPSSTVEVGVATSESTSWEDYYSGSRPTIDQFGKLFIPIRTQQDTFDLDEPLESIDGFLWRATYGRWDPESRVVIRAGGTTIVEPEEYTLYPREGLVVFNRKRTETFTIDVENTDKVRIGLRIINRFAGDDVTIRGIGYFWNTNVFLPPPLSERPPTASDLRVFPTIPTIYAKMSASYVFSDLNRDEEDLEQTDIRWFINGVEVEFLRGLREWNDLDNFEDPVWVYAFSFRPEDIPEGTSTEQFARERGDSLLSVGDVIWFTVRPSDGKVFGDLVRSPSVTVAAAPPFITELAVRGRTSTGGTQEVVTTATTAFAEFNFFDDGGDNDSTIIWFVNDTEYKRGPLNGFTNGFNNNEIVPGEVNNGLVPLSIANVIEVEVRPAAGNTAGEPVRSDPVTVENAPPVVSSVTVTPTEPAPDSFLEVSYNFFDTDIEQGSTTQSDQSSIRWYRQRADEEVFTEVAAIANQDTVSPSLTISGDQWYAEIIPFDGTSVGTAVRSNTVTIQ